MTILSWPGPDALPPVRKWSASEPRQLYRNRRITVEEVQVSTGTGTPFPHQVIRFAADSVAAVVHSPGRGVLMLYRHRFITDRAGLALPAGGIESGEDPVDAAIREVFEETGCKVQDARLMGSADVLPGVADKVFWFTFGTAEASGDVPEPADAHESTALYWVPVSELFGLMTAGLISAQPSMLALLYAERAGLLRELRTEEAGHGRTQPGMGRRADRIRALAGTHNPIRPTRHCYNATDGHFACVDAEGEVYLGNPEIGDRRYSIGNILTAPWHDIWRSPRHLEVIALMDTLQQSAQCRLSACRHVRANIGAEQALSLIKPALPLDSFL